MTRPYAEGTRVEVHKTQGDMRTLLARSGATRFQLMDEDDGGVIAFDFRGRRYGFTVRHPMHEDPAGRGRWYNANRYVGIADQAEGEWRRRWRARLMWLKMVMEYAEGEGDAEAETALTGYLLLADGRTTLAEAVARGGVPLLTAGG